MLLRYPKLIIEGTDKRVERVDLSLGSNTQKQEKTGQGTKPCTIYF